MFRIGNRSNHTRRQVGFALALVLLVNQVTLPAYGWSRPLPSNFANEAKSSNPAGLAAVFPIPLSGNSILAQDKPAAPGDVNKVDEVSAPMAQILQVANDAIA